MEVAVLAIDEIGKGRPRHELVADLTAVGIPEETIARCTKALFDAAIEVRSMQEAVRQAKPVEP